MPPSAGAAHSLRRVLGMTSEFRQSPLLFRQQDPIRREEVDDPVAPGDLRLHAAVQGLRLRRTAES